MLRVTAKLGGSFVRIPVQLTPGCLLVQALGYADADAVWRVWRGRGAAGEIRVFLPRMSVAHQKARRLKLLQLLADGVTMREAAHRIGVTERTGYNMKAKAETLHEDAATRPQLDLFPAA